MNGECKEITYEGIVRMAKENMESKEKQKKKRRGLGRTDRRKKVPGSVSDIDVRKEQRARLRKARRSLGTNEPYPPGTSTAGAPPARPDDER